MLDAGRYSPYKDLSEYEKEMEGVALVTSDHPKIDHQTSGYRSAERSRYICWSGDEVCYIYAIEKQIEVA